jgi:hypothetical protein
VTIEDIGVDMEEDRWQKTGQFYNNNVYKVRCVQWN